jgi:hypothetical protein
MGRVTNRLESKALADLLARPPRATLAFLRDGQVELLPVAYRGEGGRHWVGLGHVPPPTDTPASLVIDDGFSWFALRAVTVRGTLAHRGETPSGASVGLDWLELVPRHVTAWDYGSLHEEPDA